MNARLDADASPRAAAQIPVQAPDRRAVPTVGLLLLAVAAFAVAVFGGNPSAEEPLAADGGTGTPSLGDPAAPVVVVEYSDFQCPYCQRHALQVKPRIMADYVEAGQVRYEWRDLPFQGQESINAALAARAAQEQGRFWEYHEGLFQRRDEGFSAGNLRRLAADVGLDLARYDEALRTGRHSGLVQADAEQGQRLGITGTPAFVINGTLVVGAQPYDVLAEVIDAALDEARA